MRRTPCWALILAVAGCAVGPDYRKPPAEVPPAWQPDAPWHEAAPSDGALKGDWWRLFQDDTLNPLVDRALTGNQNLRVAAARLGLAAEDRARSAKCRRRCNCSLGRASRRLSMTATQNSRELGIKKAPNFGGLFL